MELRPGAGVKVTDWPSRSRSWEAGRLFPTIRGPVEKFVKSLSMSVLDQVVDSLGEIKVIIYLTECILK